VVVGGSVAHADVGLDEARFVQRMNAARASVGVAPLVVAPRLVSLARAWSRLLLERSTSSADCVLVHNQNLLEVLRPASKVAENVGCGDGDANALHVAFMNSSHHRDNILDPSFDTVGVGVMVSGDTMFVSVEFVQSVDFTRATSVPLPNGGSPPAVVSVARFPPAVAPGAAPARRRASVPVVPPSKPKPRTAKSALKKQLRRAAKP
jgi:Cysteine-rich secretory protein family